MDNFLSNSQYQQALNDVFDSYHKDLEEILELATIESDGLRPDNLTNEIYSLFHHISRSLSSKNTIDEAICEVNRAKDTHLKRAILDSYKICINGVLRRESKTADILETLILDEDFRSCIDDCTTKVKKIKEVKKKIKSTYLEAKKYERKGDFPSAIIYYNKALEEANVLNPFLEEFQNDKTYIIAIKRLRKKDRDNIKNKIFTIVIVILTAILTSVCNFTGTYFIDKYKTEKQQKEMIQQTVHNKVDSSLHEQTINP